MNLRQLLCKTAIGIAALGSQGHVLAADKVTLMVNWYLNSEHIPFFLGKEKGYFKDEGIDLEIQEGRGSGVTVQAVAAKSVTFGYADIGTMIKAASKGAPVKGVGVLLQTSPFAAISFEDSNIKTPADLKGKIVAITPGDSLTQLWPLFLKTNGLTDAQVKTVAGDPQTKMNALLSGRADAMLGYPHDQGVAILETTGKPVSSLRFADSGINLVSSGLVAHTDTIARNPDLIRRFLTAATKSVEDAVRSPEAAADAMLKVAPKAGNRKAFVSGFKESAKLHGPRPFRVQDKVLDDSLTVLIQYGGLDASAKGDVSKYITQEFLPK